MLGRRMGMQLESMKMDPSFLSRNVNEGFSGGEKKRNEILQLSVLEPEVAILDEIDSGLDVDALRDVSSAVNGLRCATPTSPQSCNAVRLPRRFTLRLWVLASFPLPRVCVCCSCKNCFPQCTAVLSTHVFSPRVASLYSLYTRIGSSRGKRPCYYNRKGSRRSEPHGVNPMRRPLLSGIPATFPPRFHGRGECAGHRTTAWF